MSTGLFSTYSTGENRVTASVLAVLSSLTLSRTERLLGALAGDADLELVQFQNQPAAGGKGVPDAIILASIRVLIETKMARGGVRKEQLVRHLARLEESQETRRLLIVLTPDESIPSGVSELRSDRVAWASFSTLHQAIDLLLDDRSEVVSEREAFLLRELQIMLEREGLIRNSRNVLIVPARVAWHEYLRHGAYVCQPDRPFQPVDRMGFYADGEIKPNVPKILAVVDRLSLDRDSAPEEWQEIVSQILDDPQSERVPGSDYKFFKLSGPNDPRTLRLKAPIKNDLVAKSGRSWAFVLGQRYVGEPALVRSTTTRQLVELDGQEL